MRIMTTKARVATTRSRILRRDGIVARVLAIEELGERGLGGRSTKIRQIKRLFLEGCCRTLFPTRFSAAEAQEI